MTGRFLVIGGDAAGLSAAGKAKRDTPDVEVVVFERGEWVSYGACGLPYYVEGRIASLDDLVVMQPHRIIDEREIDLRRGHEVTGIDREEQEVTVDGPEDSYTESYDALLVATGGRASVPDVPGKDLDGVFTIRSLQAGRALKDYLTSHGVDQGEQHGVEPAADRGEDVGIGREVEDHLDVADVTAAGVVGANKIGIELAEAFADRGLTVHVFDESQRVLPSFGREVGVMVETHLWDAGVELHLGTAVEEFTGEDGTLTAIETAEGQIPVGAVLADVGIEPEVDVAAAAGVELGPSGAIATDDVGRTNDPRIFAAGDCAEKRHLLTGEAVHWPFALAANRAGRAVGRTVAGRETEVGGVVETLVMGAFGLEVSRTGIVDHHRARAAGFDPVSETITTISRAHYYPGWSRLVVHVTADRESRRLLGANMVGEEGAAHRINSVAAAITAGMTVPEVGNLDFGYAPPFGPVWDPVLGAAKVLGEKLAAA